MCNFLCISLTKIICREELYNLDRENTYYVGDRSLDIECAENAGTKSILYLPENSAASPTGKETFVVKDLLDIQDIVRGLTRMTFAV